MQLEERLTRLDSDPTFTFFRGSLRDDRNGERAQLMANIDHCLKEYGKVPTIQVSSLLVSRFMELVAPSCDCRFRVIDNS